ALEASPTFHSRRLLEGDVAGLEERLEIRDDFGPAAGYSLDKLGALTFELVADRELHGFAAKVRIVVGHLDIHRAARIAFRLQLRFEFVAPANHQPFVWNGFENLAGVGGAAVLESEGPG